VCVIVPNFTPIGQTVPEIWLFGYFKMAAVRDLGFVLCTFGHEEFWWFL